MKLLRECKGDLVAMDALALAILVKMRFVSSTIHNYNPYRMRELFGIGDARARKLVAKCKQLGIARMEGNDLVFGRIRDYGYDTYFTLTIGQQNSKDELDKVSVKYIRDVLLGELLKDVVETNNRLNDTIVKIESGRWANRPVFRYVRRRMQDGYRVEKTNTLTYNFVASQLGVGRSKAIQIVKFLESRCELGKVRHFCFTDEFPADADVAMLNQYVTDRRDMEMVGYKAYGVYVRTRKGIALSSGNRYFVGDGHIHFNFERNHVAI